MHSERGGVVAGNPANQNLTVPPVALARVRLSETGKSSSFEQLRAWIDAFGPTFTLSEMARMIR